jgi:hypothetical protein
MVPNHQSEWISIETFPAAFEKGRGSGELSVDTQLKKGQISSDFTYVV